MKSRSLHVGKANIILGLILLLIVSATVYIYLQIRTDEIETAVKEEKTIKLLLIVRGKEHSGFSEAIFFQSGTGKAAVIDVPMNTAVMLENKSRIDRIDTGFDASNPETYLARVEKLFNQEIPYYIYVDSENYQKIIDLVEGVNLFIANPVETSFRGETALLPSGSVTLDGAKAITYGLYKEDDGQRPERVSRRQKLVQASLKKFSQKAEYLQQPEVLSTMHALIRSNMSKHALGSLLRGLGYLDQDQIVFQRVLGDLRRVDEEELIFPHYEGSLLRETVNQTLVSLNNADVISSEELNVTIEVLNGTLRNGLAARTTQIFESYGYDVSRVANADSQDREETVVIDRRGSISAAQKVAKVIRCDNVISEPRTNPGEEPPVQHNEIDVTVILGKDFDGRYCKE